MAMFIEGASFSEPHRMAAGFLRTYPSLIFSFNIFFHKQFSNGPWIQNKLWSNAVNDMNVKRTTNNIRDFARRGDNNIST
jgi:hypothetical protein